VEDEKEEEEDEKVVVVMGGGFQHLGCRCLSGLCFKGHQLEHARPTKGLGGGGSSSSSSSSRESGARRGGMYATYVG
jgi:hypothetical protein